MSFEDLLINTCTVKRFIEGAPDSYGVPVKAWSDHLVSQDCRLASSSGREIKVGAEVVIADYKLFIGDVDITEQDRVIVGSITYEVLLVQTYADSVGNYHKQCWLRVAR